MRFRFRAARPKVRSQNQTSATLAEATAQIADALRALQQITERETLACGEVLESIVDKVRHLSSESEQALAASILRSNAMAVEFAEGMKREMQGQEVAVNQVLELAASIEAAIGAIDGLTRYANMLAINAKIEAVRMGEPGRSFEVIADNLRGFSDTIAEAATRVNVSIEGVREGLPLVFEHAASMQERTRLFTEQVSQQVRAASVNNSTGAKNEDGLNEVIELSNQALSHLQFQDPVSQKLGLIRRDLRERVANLLDDSARGGPQLLNYEPAGDVPSPGEMMLF